MHFLRRVRLLIAIKRASETEINAIPRIPVTSKMHLRVRNRRGTRGGKEEEEGRKEKGIESINFLVFSSPRFVFTDGITRRLCTHAHATARYRYTVYIGANKRGSKNEATRE